jgi:galactokinase
VNLIGDHTDHTGGLVLPIAIDLGTTITGERAGRTVQLTSASEPGAAVMPVDIGDPMTVEPRWGRYVAGVVSEVHPSTGFTGTVETTLPVGAGLSSSAALEVAFALALGFEGDPLDLAQVCQRAEQRASGVPCGIMDQLASAAGVQDHALRIDCTTLAVDPVPIPDDLEVVVVDSGERRALATSAYADRAEACQAAQAEVGPLRSATPHDLAQIGDTTVRRRARHVVTENERVDALAEALRTGDRRAVHDLMVDSHSSLRADFEVSTPRLDALVASLTALDGVVGARLTGAGFGGCVVALVERDAPIDVGAPQWRVRASRGAHLEGAP